MPNDRHDYTAGTGFHHKSWQEPAPPIPRWVYLLAAILLAVAGLAMVGDAVLP